MTTKGWRSLAWNKILGVALDSSLSLPQPFPQAPPPISTPPPLLSPGLIFSCLYYWSSFLTGIPVFALPQSIHLPHSPRHTHTQLFSTQQQSSHLKSQVRLCHSSTQSRASMHAAVHSKPSLFPPLVSLTLSPTPLPLAPCSLVRGEGAGGLCCSVWNTSSARNVFPPDVCLASAIPSFQPCLKCLFLEEARCDHPV